MQKYKKNGRVCQQHFIPDVLVEIIIYLVGFFFWIMMERGIFFARHDRFISLIFKY